MLIKDATAELFLAGLGLIYPNVCQLCGEEPALPAQGYVGCECRKKIQTIEPPFCSRCGIPVEGSVSDEFICSSCQQADFNFITARGAARVNPSLLDIIHRYKYQGALYFEPFLEELLTTQAGPAMGGQCDLIVPVPLHPVKQREREFNQAERLAACLSRATGIPMNPSLVRRAIPTESQTRLDRVQRAANVRNAFVPVANAKLHGERVVLIDDILTTCATTNACAGALRQAGAGPIRVWAVARGV
jgi:ComF family protein